MFCTKCGAQIKGEGKFCPKCGAPMKGTPPKTQRQIQPEEQVRPRMEREMDDEREAQPEKKGIGSAPVIAALALLILLLAAAIGGGAYYFLTHSGTEDYRREDREDDEEEEEEPESEETGEEQEGQSISDEEEKPQEETAAAEEAVDEQDVWMDADYILDFSAWREVTEEDLEGLNPEQLRIARNEIYARHGRQFLDEALNQWFIGKEWYRDISEKYTPEEFDSLSPGPLSDLERKNAAFISDYEKKLEETAD